MKKPTIFGAILMSILAVLIIAACNHKSAVNAQNDVIFKNLDVSVKPGDDFFKYANGAWPRKNPIPPLFPRLCFRLAGAGKERGIVEPDIDQRACAWFYAR